MEFETTVTNVEFVLLEEKSKVITIELSHVEADILNVECIFMNNVEKDATAPKMDEAALARYGLNAPVGDLNKIQFALMKLAVLQEARNTACQIGYAKLSDDEARKKARLDAQQQADNIRASLGTNIQAMAAAPPPIPVIPLVNLQAIPSDIPSGGNLGSQSPKRSRASVETVRDEQ